MFGAFSETWRRLPGDCLTNSEPTLCIFFTVCVHACQSSGALSEKPGLCVWVSETRGMLIFWIFILVLDTQQCPVVFVRKQTENVAPEEKKKIRIWSILNFLLWSLFLAKKEAKDWNRKKRGRGVKIWQRGWKKASREIREREKRVKGSSRVRGEGK